MIRIYEYSQVDPAEIFQRETPISRVEEPVAAILADVKRRGDEAVLEYTRRFDRCDIASLAVTEAEIEEAFAQIEPEFLEVLQKAAANIREFHTAQVRQSLVLTPRSGVVLGQRITPIERVGLYVPGGTAAYPSTVLMDAIPAKIAGCETIVMATPPGADGKINPAILAAAKIAGVTDIFKMGGAQAIGALAYGTQSVPKVDKIVGPGNAYVAEAKKQVFGMVAIDMIAGPSEILVLADGRSDAKVVAADMLSQAEHDRNATAVLVTESMDLAKAVQEELEIQLEALPRRDIARASVDNNGMIIVAESLTVGIEVANKLAPEHLELQVDDPFAYLDSIRNAGSVFLGRSCPEALGDYFAGPNHTLPTSGTARFSSPLGVDDFVKKSQFLYYTPDALNAVAEDVARFARKEGLEAHARSAMVRK